MSPSVYDRYKDALRRGHVASMRGQTDAAIAAYGEAAAIAPERALPHVSIGAILVKLGKTDEALAAYDRALALAPRDEVALRGRADQLAIAGRRSEAAGTLDRLAALHEAAGKLPEATDATTRGLTLAESRERRRHLAGLAERLRDRPDDPAAARALAEAMAVLEPPPAAPVEVVPEPRETAVGTAAEAEGESQAVAAEPEPEPAAEPAAAMEPEAEPEPIPDGVALGAEAEAALVAGDAEAARSGFLAAASAHRRAGRTVAAIDACYLAIAVAPSDPDLHLMLAELYLDYGWRGQAVEKVGLLERLAELDDDAETLTRLRGFAAARLPEEPRLAGPAV
jgi:tetratricopeptide (TPR) repeat protein